MQQLAYIVIGNTRIRVLARYAMECVYLKKADGEIQKGDKFLEDESDFLSLPYNWSYIQQLHEGKTIQL
jgi:hypothetical protein